MLVDQEHIGWKSWKIIARTILAQHLRSSWPSTYSQGTWGNFEETRGGVGKSGVLEHKNGNISETSKYSGKVTMEGLQELSNDLSNGTIPDHLRPSLPQDWGLQPHPNSNRYYLRNG